MRAYQRIARWVAAMTRWTGCIFVCLSLAGCPGPCNSSVETDPSVLLKPAPIDGEAPGGTPRMSLQEAAAKGAIKYELQGTGGSSGDVLEIRIQRVGSSDLDVYIRPGTIFTNSNAKGQRMVGWGVAGIVHNNQLYEATSMYLPDTGIKTYRLEAYCLDFRLDNPTREDRLLPVAAAVESLDSVDVRAAQIIYEGKKRDLPIEGIQSLLWMDHEELTPKAIQAKFEVNTETLDKALEIWKTLPPPKRLGGGRQTVKCK
jgi:hypothetical protein